MQCLHGKHVGVEIEIMFHFGLWNSLSVNCVYSSKIVEWPPNRSDNNNKPACFKELESCNIKKKALQKAFDKENYILFSNKLYKTWQNYKLKGQQGAV